MSGEEEIIEVTIDMAELKKMKVPEVKKKVAELGLSTKGTKAELLARVEKYLHEQEEEELLEEVEEVDEEVDEGVEGIEGAEVEGGQGASLDESKGDSILEQAEVVKAESEDNKEVTIDPIAPAEPIKPATVSVGNLTTSQAERIAQRAAKFGGNTSEEAKKVARAERFGTTLDNVYKGLGKRAPPTEEELERLKKRAERFGSSVSPAITSIEEDEKKKKRSERFGLTATELCVEDRKKLRAARFGTS